MTKRRLLAAGPGPPARSHRVGGFIERVEELLFGGTRARDIKNVVIGEFYHLGDGNQA